MNAANAVTRLGIASVAVPALCSMLSMLAVMLLPGVHCDEGSGCRGLGALNDVVTLMLFGGFVGAIAASIAVLPAALLIAAALRKIAGPPPGQGRERCSPGDRR